MRKPSFGTRAAQSWEELSQRTPASILHAQPTINLLSAKWILKGACGGVFTTVPWKRINLKVCTHGYWDSCKDVMYSCRMFMLVLISTIACRSESSPNLHGTACSQGTCSFNLHPSRS